MSAIFSPKAIIANILLFCSCALMITAWYLHLNPHLHSLTMIQAIAMSWAIALGEYILMVPANRIGHEVLSAAQLRAIAELWIIVAFLVFNRYVLNEPVKVNHLVGFAFVVFGVWLVMLGPFNTIVYQPAGGERARLKTGEADDQDQGIVKKNPKVNRSGYQDQI